jgi:hypothetical protein
MKPFLFAILMALMCTAANAQTVTTVIGGDENYTVDVAQSSPWVVTNLYAETTGSFSERLAKHHLLSSTPVYTFLAVDPTPVITGYFGDNYSVSDGIYQFCAEDTDVTYNQDQSRLSVYNDEKLLYNGYASFMSDGQFVRIKSDQVNVTINTSKQTFEVTKE